MGPACARPSAWNRRGSSHASARLPQSSRSLREAFPEIRGISYTNLKYMRQFASNWLDGQIGPRSVGQLPWGHIRCLLDKLDEPAARVGAQSAVKPAWSRKLLERHIATRGYEREGKALTNFLRTLEPSEGDLVAQIVHEDYHRSRSPPQGATDSDRICVALCEDASDRCSKPCKCYTPHIMWRKNHSESEV